MVAEPAPGFGRQRPVMLYQPLQRFPGQVEAIKGRIAPFKGGNDTQALGVVVEAAGRRESLVEGPLAGMAERRMPEVVGERQGFRQVFVESERTGDRAGDLGD